MNLFSAHNRLSRCSQMGLGITTLFLSGCSLGGNNADIQTKVWNSSGSIVLSRMAPQSLRGEMTGSVRNSNGLVSSPDGVTGLGFMEMMGQSSEGSKSPSFNAAKWLLIDKIQQRVGLMEGEAPDTLMSSFSLSTSSSIPFLSPLTEESATKIPTGAFEVLHKQKEPSWYAPDEYFIHRHLPIPASNDSSRFLRGALGEYVIYLDQNTPLHCSLIETPEVGGVRLPQAEMEKIYYQLEVGSRIMVR